MYRNTGWWNNGRSLSSKSDWLSWALLLRCPCGAPVTLEWCNYVSLRQLIVWHAKVYLVSVYTRRYHHVAGGVMRNKCFGIALKAIIVMMPAVSQMKSLKEWYKAGGQELFFGEEWFGKEGKRPCTSSTFAPTHKDVQRPYHSLTLRQRHQWTYPFPSLQIKYHAALLGISQASWQSVI